ncbi:MAG TPA: chitobiase/beta-hexosaminidase C-terminal domain-containing protein [Candidatus Eisenbergiella intestinipullorum]|nr:chitobiase/beta-hexosaminidase C-terminal domain-containing protein [Candidatus Eisenbergiella intestinipullorum]
MKCPRCGSEIKDGMLFCENCGEEIRIVQDFEPEIGGIVTGFEQASNGRQSKENTEIREGPEEKEGFVPPAGQRAGRMRRRVLWTAGGLSALLVCVLLAAAVLCLRSADYQYQRAMSYIKAGAYDAARPYAERAVRLSPDDPKCLAAFAVCLSQSGLKEETVSVCRRILELDDTNRQAYEVLVAVYEEDGEYEKINELLLSCPDEQIVSSYPAYVAKPPEFSYESGVYDEALSLRLSANTGGTIYYTMDGSRPDENSQVYASPIFLESGSYRIRAIFVNEYGVSSSEADGSYYVDVTVPEAPEVLPEEGSYTRPTLIIVHAGENCRVYYTTDGTAPTQDGIEYNGPFPMPVGVTRFRFICFGPAGAAGEETQVTYSLNLHASLSIEAARNRLLLELIAADVIQGMDGTVETGTGHYVYNYRCAITVDGSDYYLYREYYEDDAGNSAGTGTDYVVNIMNGECYRAVQAAQEKKADAESTPDPWSLLTLQKIDSRRAPATEEDSQKAPE